MATNHDVDFGEEFSEPDTTAIITLTQIERSLARLYAMVE